MQRENIKIQSIEDFKQKCIMPLQVAIRKFAENMVIIMSVLKTFVQNLKNIKNEIEILVADDENDEEEK